MKKSILPLFALLISLASAAQEISAVYFSNGTDVKAIAFRTDQDIIIKVSLDGSLQEWGTPWSLPGYSTPGKLQAYMGRVDYYGQEYDSVLRGKVRSIGTCILNYYGSNETKSRVGKLRSVGRAQLDYYDTYENTAFRGKLKLAGQSVLSYYPDYENEAYRGKLKSVGTTDITYYSSFDDKNIRGKVKAIGPYSYSWYTQTDSRGYPGSLKSGLLQQTLSGVSYILF